MRRAVELKSYHFRTFRAKWKSARRSGRRRLFGVTGVAASAALIVIVFAFQNCSGNFRSLSSGATLASGFDDPTGPVIPVDTPVATPEPMFTGLLTDSVAVQTRSRFELLYAAQDLLQDTSLTTDFIRTLAADQKVAGFEAASTQTLDSAYFEARLAYAEDVAARALRSRKVFICAPTQVQDPGYAGCIQSVVESFASRAFRRDLTATEKTSLQQIFDGAAASARTEIGSSPRTAPIGYLDTVSNNGVRGWTLDPEWSGRTVEVHFYIENAGRLEYLGNTYANQPRGDVNAHFAEQGYVGDHGYSFQVPSMWADGVERKIHAYAIGQGAGNPELSDSPKPYRATARDDLPSNDLPQLSATTEEGLRAAFTYILMSPSFQLRTVNTSVADSTADVHQLELANRLALFLTGSVPDAQLLADAKSGLLNQTAVYEGHVRRLIRTYSDRIANNVIGQWLGYRDFSMLENPSTVERAMARESQLVFKELIDQNLPARSILSPGFTFVNGILASHYGMGGASGDAFAKVMTSDRGGILTQGSFLRATAPIETKPIVRGKWVQANLLCHIIPPPSAELFQQIADAKKNVDPNWSIAKKLEVHRNTGPVCTSCHKYMDPLGLALENYGPFGLWRDRYDDGKDVIANGDLDGIPFNNPRELTSLIAQRSDFADCAVEKLMTHALSRPVSEEEGYYVRQIARSANGLSDILFSIAKSPAFKKNRNDL